MSKHYAIKCTHCAAPLDILGGGRVRTITCSYCHAILDMNDHYKVLAKFNDSKRPDAPFEIGMRGNIKGVEWQIIGWIHYKTGEFPSEAWDEFFLFSPTHGYAWLVYEKNKLFFSKRIRDFDIYAWQQKQHKSLFYRKGHYLQKETAYLTYVEYVEGELNWIAKFGDSFTTWDYNGVGYKALSIEQTANELEVYHTQRLDKADIYKAFKLKYSAQPDKTYTEKEKREASTMYEDTIEDKPNYTGFKILLLLLGIVMLFSFFSTKEISAFRIDQNISTHYFSIDSDAFLTEIEIDTPSGLKNSTLTIHKGKKKIFYIDTHTAYYVKKFFMHTWSPSSTKTKIYLKLNIGKYDLSFNRNSALRNDIIIHINEKSIRLKYIFPLFIILSIVLLYYYREYFGWKILMVPILILITIFGYTFFGGEALFILIVLGILIYSDYDDNYNYDWNDWDD